MKLIVKVAAPKHSNACIFSENFNEFNKRLSDISKQDPTNIRVAALSAFAANQIRQKDLYPFCKNPMDFINVSHFKNHIADCDKFIVNLLDELNNETAVWDPQNKATNGGFQTSENLLSNRSKNMKIVEKIIETELSSYKSKFHTCNDVFIQSWPEAFDLKAWYVRILKKGYQDSHIHPGGWGERRTLFKNNR
jgi:hypothetical protein